MREMFFLLRTSFDVLPLVATAPVPILWALLTLLSVQVSYTQRRLSHGTRSASQATAGCWLLELVSLAGPAVLMLAYGRYFWVRDVESASQAPAGAMLVPYALTGLHVALVVWLNWRHRRRPWSTFVVSALSTWWVLGALFTTSMAVTNVWL